MAVSKRTRFEVLRRDNFTCRYCGAKAPDVELHVDHVHPRLHGGNDHPRNLVAACKDCNLGKSAILLDSEKARDVSDESFVRLVQSRLGPCGHCAACVAGSPSDCYRIATPLDALCESCGHPACNYQIGEMNGSYDGWRAGIKWAEGRN